MTYAPQTNAINWQQKTGARFPTQFFLPATETKTADVNNDEADAIAAVCFTAAIAIKQKGIKKRKRTMWTQPSTSTDITVRKTSLKDHTNATTDITTNSMATETDTIAHITVIKNLLEDLVKTMTDSTTDMITDDTTNDITKPKKASNTETWTFPDLKESTI